MKDALAAALAQRAEIVFARDAGAVADLRVAAGRSDFVMLVIDETVPKLDSAMLVAALGPLAVEWAPAVRIAALEIAAGAEREDVVAAARYLATAASSTGQILRIAPRQG